MKVTILDDYLDTLRTLACCRELDRHDVTIWTDPTDDLDELPLTAYGETVGAL